MRILIMAAVGIMLSRASADIERQAQGIVRINHCMEQMIEESLLGHSDAAVEVYLAFMPSAYGEEGQRSWETPLNKFSALIQSEKVESCELVSIERLSTQTYICHYMLHGKSGPVLFSAKIFQYKGGWLSVGFSYKNYIDDIVEELEGIKKLREPIRLKLSLSQKKTEEEKRSNELR